MEKAPEFATPLSVFISCASTDEDEVLLQKFEKHLALLKKQGVIMPWHHRKTLVGMNKQQEHEKHLESASLIILLISADFLASDDCNREMELALARQEEGVLVIPVLLHPADLHGAPIESLLCLPRDQRPVALWENKDAAFTTIVAEIRTTIEEYLSPQQNKPLSEKEKRLRALIPDHNGFLKDRLESFVGRQQELVEVQEKINQRLQTGGYVTITGHAGQGKSSIIAKLIEIYGVEQVAYHFIPINPGPDHQVGLLRNLMARLILKYKLSDLYVASDNRAALRDYFPKVLTEVANQGGQEIIFVDGLDQLEEDFNGARDLSFLPTNPSVGVVFVLGTRPNDAMKPLELLKPHDEYRLPNLSRQDFDRILQHRHVSLKQTVADQFYKIMGENALYLDLVAKELIAYDAIDPLSIITRVTANPANIFSLSLERLKRQGQLWERVIYPVLGILLTAQEPMLLLCMKDILQVEDYKLRDGITKLGGLVIEDAQRRYSLFHLKLRDYLRQDAQNLQKEYLFSTEEEEGCHAHLAEWCERGDLSQIWQDISDLKEQRRHEYARQHYITHLYYARKWKQLFNVLDEGSYGHAKEQYDVTTRSYVQDLDRGRQAAVQSNITQKEAIAMLPHLWRYTLLRGSLRSHADHYPRETFQLLLLLGREKEVLGLVELLTDPVYKAEVLLLVAEHLSKQSGRRAECEQTYLRASEASYKIEKSDKRTELLIALASSLAEAQQWKRAEEVAHAMEESYERAEALKALASSLAEAQQWERAEEVIRVINEVDERVEALSVLAGSLTKAKYWEKAEPLWREAERVARAIKENGKQIRALWVLANLLIEAQLWKEAERVSRAIKESGKRAEALSALASSLAEAQQWKRAEEVAHAIEENDKRVKALSALATFLTKDQRWERAEQVWKEAERVARAIEESDKRARALSALASSLVEIQQKERSAVICTEIERGIRLIEESYERAEALRALAISLAEAQQWERAERVAYAIEESNVRVIALRALSSSLAEAQQWEEAERVARAIEKIYEQGWALSALAISLAEAQQWEEAERVARAIEKGYERTEALSALAISLAEAQQWERAERVIHAIEESDGRTEVLRVLASSLIKAQQWERAEPLWEEAERVARAMKRNDERARALSALASSLAEAQQWERAEPLWEEAERVAHAMKRSYRQAETLRILVISLVEAQQWKRAERVTRAIEKSYQRAEVLSVLASSLAKAQQWERAEPLWEEAEEVARAIEESEERADVLNTLVDSLCSVCRYEQAISLVQTSWLQVETRSNAFLFFPLALGLIPLQPEIGDAFYRGFQWVDAFLNG